MPRPNHDTLCNDWNELSSQMGNACQAVSDAENAVLQAMLNCREGSSEYTALTVLVERLGRAANELGGLSYLCSPQSEWLGGDDYAVRIPHIVNDSR